MAAPGNKVVLTALIGNVLIAVAKFIAAAFTGSAAMLAEGIHSVADTGNQLLLLHGLKQAGRPAGGRFPYGHGKEVYFWSFIVASLLFALGAGVSLYEGVGQLLDPQPLRDLELNYVVLGLAMLFEGAAWYFAFQEFTRAKGKWGYLETVQRGRSPSLFAVLFEDSAGMLGLMVAFFGLLLGQLTGNPYWDGAAAVVIGLILGGTAVWLAYEARGLLIGANGNQEVVEGVRQLAAAREEVEQVRAVLTLPMGPDCMLVTLSVSFREQTAAELAAAIQALDEAVKRAYPNVKRLFVEAEALRPKAPPVPEG